MPRDLLTTITRDSQGVKSKSSAHEDRQGNLLWDNVFIGCVLCLSLICASDKIIGEELLAPYVLSTR